MSLPFHDFGIGLYDTSPPDMYPTASERVSAKLARKRRRKELKARREVQYPSSDNDDLFTRTKIRIRPRHPRPLHIPFLTPSQRMGSDKDFLQVVEEFVETVVPNFTDDEFKKYFRVTRETLEELQACFEINETAATLVPAASAGNVRFEDYMLVFLWCAGNAQDHETVGETFFLNVDEVSMLMDIIGLFFTIHAQKLYPLPKCRLAASSNAKRYREIYGFPETIGCLTSHHLRMRGEIGWSSVQVVSDSHGRFLNVHVNFTKKLHPRDLLADSVLADGLREICHGQYHLAADQNYFIRDWLLTPFDKPEAKNEILYNQRHKVVLASAYNAWDDLLYRFPILKCKIFLNDENFEPILNACVVIQNICMCECDFFNIIETSNFTDSTQTYGLVEPEVALKDDPDLRSFGLLKRRRLSHGMMV